jgi:hypothetical protein
VGRNPFFLLLHHWDISHYSCPSPSPNGGRLGNGSAAEKSPGDPGLDDGDQSQKATTRANTSFGSRQSVCQPCLHQALLKQHDMIASMSRKGNCWDNAPVERFFSSLKREWTGNRLYRTRQAPIADVREYVAVYYNAIRLHSTLGYKTPINYENDLSNVSGIT